LSSQLQGREPSEHNVWSTEIILGENYGKKQIP